MKKVLLVDMEKCSGCRICEIACSWFHEEEFNPAKSRIQIVSKKKEAINYPMVCEQCEKAPCKEVCPTEAIYKNEETGAWMVDEKKCIGCKFCVIGCPFGAVIFSPDKKIVEKCDLCEGDPQCVKFCPMEAIEYIEEEKVGMKRKRKVSEKIFEVMGVK